MGFAHKVHSYGVLGTWYGEIPNGCRYCIKGSKSVIFVSGTCGVDCFYCPISFERRKPNAFYVDEERFATMVDIVDEIVFIKAEGASITGGEPFQVYYIVANIIKTLKDVFGEKFHIHLYSSGFGTTKEAIKYLASLGLDEIRFHIVDRSIMRLVEFTVRETNMDVGIEVPALLDFDWLWRIVIDAEKSGAKFVNINELEVSETNVEDILIRGFELSDDGRSVRGSAEVAKKVIEKAFQENLNISVHFCSALYKDVIQYRNRLKRKSWICSQPTDKLNDDGTIRRGERDIVPLIHLCSNYIKI
ncbi:MAG: hypothetical protein QXH73_05265 [Ignisphaera sp.]